MIKDYFADYSLHTSDVTFDLKTPDDDAARDNARAMDGDADRHRRGDDDRRPTEARRGVRRRRDLLPHLRRRWSATSTSTALIGFHRGQGVLATLTAVQPPGRFGALVARDGETRSRHSRRSRTGDGGVGQRRFLRAQAAGPGLCRGRLDRLGARAPRAPGRRGAARRPSSTGASGRRMDTLRDKAVLEADWASGDPPWRVW